jgi:nitroreductase
VSYNQAKVEEASAILVACGDKDGWRRDLEEMLRMGRAGGMPESYAAQAAANVPEYLSSFSDEQMQAWLNKQVTIAATTMMWMAEVMGYDTAMLEGFEQQGVCETLRLPMSYWVVSMLAIGHLKGADKFDGGRFDMSHTVFSEEFGKPLKLA